MILQLALPIAATKGADLRLDQLLLAWAEDEGFFETVEGSEARRNVVYLEHCHGLTGNMSGALAFVRLLMPSARLALDLTGSRAHASVDLGFGRGPRAVGGTNAANALLGAAVAAWVLDRAPMALAPANTSIALEAAL